MGNFNSATPKPHYFFGNTQKIQALDRGKLDRQKFETKVKTVIKYKNKQQKDCYCGTPHLRGTEFLV